MTSERLGEVADEIAAFGRKYKEEAPLISGAILTIAGVVAADRMHELAPLFRQLCKDELDLVRANKREYGL